MAEGPIIIIWCLPQNLLWFWPGIKYSIISRNNIKNYLAWPRGPYSLSGETKHKDTWEQSQSSHKSRRNYTARFGKGGIEARFSSVLLFIYLSICLFVGWFVCLFWLCWVLVVAHRIFVVACGLSRSMWTLSCGMWTLSCGMHAGSSSPTRDWTQAPCIGSVESYPLDHQESSSSVLLNNHFWAFTVSLAQC